MITAKQSAKAHVKAMKEKEEMETNMSLPDLNKYDFSGENMSPSDMDPVLRAQIVEDVATVLTAIQQDHSRRFIEREEQSYLCWLTLVSNANAVLLGPPGTSKSQLVRTLFDYLEDAKEFHLTCHPATRPEDLFGGIDIPSMRDGVWRNLTEDALPGAECGFLDEIFKTNPGTLTSLLEIMEPEDRRFKGSTVRTSAVFGASNETPRGLDRGDALLAPLWDRFLIRFHCEPIKSELGWTRMMFEGKPVKSKDIPKLKLAHIRFLQQCKTEVIIPDVVQDSIVQLRGILLSEKIVLSDRRWAQLVRMILPAVALMDGRMYCEVNDLERLAACIWDIAPGSERAKVDPILTQIASPTATELITYCQKAEELLDQLMMLDRQEKDLQASAPTLPAEKVAQARTELVQQRGQKHTLVVNTMVALKAAISEEEASIAVTGKKLIGQKLARHVKAKDLMQRLEMTRQAAIAATTSRLESMRTHQLGRVRSTP